MGVVVNAVVEVLENVVEHLLVLGVDSQARDGRGAAVADGALLHDERLRDGRHHSHRSTSTRRRTGHTVARPQNRGEFDSVAPHVTDGLRH